MTKRDIASLVIKLMGVFILLKTIGYVPMAFSEMTYAMRSERLFFAVGMVILSVLMVGISLAWALVIIFLSDKFAAKIIHEDAAVGPLTTAVSKDDVMLIAISCIGLYFIAAALPQIFSGLMVVAASVQTRIGSPFAAPSVQWSLVRQIIVPAVQIAIGLYLFIGSKGLVKFWNKIRS